jgi:pimeloyl-ACP methyl ester carboxylesterase
MEKVRTRLYAPMTSRQLPALLARAAQGDYEGLMHGGGEGGRVFADGLYLSITCAESMARMNVPEAIRESAETAFGGYRLERQREACARWPRAPADTRLMKEPPNDVPTLFIGGGRDPVSPAEWAADASKVFRHHKWLRVADGGHVFDGLSGLDTCLDATIIRLFDTGDVAGLDYSCFDSMKPPPFSTP